MIEHLTSIVDDRRADLVALSHGVHADAEVAFEEHASSRRVAESLALAGFEVRHGVGSLDTAVVATAGAGPLRIGICAEYDALPGIGHACGHNVIAAAAVGAGMALASVADQLGVEVRVIGTPAEEGGGGKILLLEQGAFDGLHAAMMVHPAPMESPAMNVLAVSHLDVAYRGTAAHSAAYPELGVNAADAFVVAQTAIGLLRQHLLPTDRVHGIVTHGGDAPNVVPDHATGRWYVRASSSERLATLESRVRQCFEAGAQATGAHLEVARHGPPYAELVSDPDLVAIYVEEAAAIGRRFPDDVAPLTGSTDMGNVSLVIPTIHPTIAIEADGAVNHQPAFAAAAKSESADRAVRDGALAMARTAAAAARDERIRSRLLGRAYASTSG